MTRYHVKLSDVPRWAKVIAPQAGGQIKAFLSDVFELLGGGSAGGGKSWFLIVDALGLQFRETAGRPAYQFPGYKAVLFRRESGQLDHLITEAKKYYLPLGFRFVYGRHGEPGPSFTHPLYGSKIFMCHMKDEDDKENHQGQEYQYVGFDELTHFSVTQYLYMFSRLRSTITGVPIRIRATTNPTGEGLWWVRKRFVDNWTPGTVKYFLGGDDPAVDPRGREVAPGTENALSRVFIPFWLSENKALVDNDPAYASRMMQMGRQMEQALLGGDWYAFGGDFFPDFDRHVEIVNPFYIPKEWKLIGSIDPGFSSPCSFGLTASDMEGNYFRIATYYESMRAPRVHAKAILQFIQDCKPTSGRLPSRIVSGTDAFAKRDQYAVVESKKTFADQFYDEAGLFLEPASTDRVQGWWNWKSLMPANYTNTRGQQIVRPARWFVFKDMNEPLLEEMAAATSDEKRPEDLKGRGNDPEVRDHSLDENRYGLMAIATTHQRPDDSPGWENKFSRGARRLSEARSGWKPGMG